MGNKSEKAIIPLSNGIPSKSSFNFESVIGKGGFGRVWRVSYKPTGQKMALKQISKAMVIESKTYQSTLNERNFLSQLDNPFIVKSHFAFQDKHYLYIAMDLLSGGDMRYHLLNGIKFTEEQTKFFICSALIGLESLSKSAIIHRDIKPENLVFDERGYLKITDFGVATSITKASNREISGTLGYMSPEVMLERHYTLMTDYFALGVVAYELMLGKRPYEGVTRNEIRRKVINSQIRITKKEIPQGWSIESADFINRLLQRTPDNRLGFRGIGDIKNHSWLKFFNWTELYEQRMPVPFKPAPGFNYDAKYCKKDIPLSKSTRRNYEKWLRDPEYVDHFINFNYSSQASASTTKEGTASTQNETEPTPQLNPSQRTNRLYVHLNSYLSIKAYLNSKKEEKVINIQSLPENIDDMRIILRSSNKNIIVVNPPTADEEEQQGAHTEKLLLAGPQLVHSHYRSPSTNTSTPQINSNTNEREGWKGRSSDKSRKAKQILSKYYMNK